jgi:hypothetical protein
LYCLKFLLVLNPCALLLYTCYLSQIMGPSASRLILLLMGWLIDKWFFIFLCFLLLQETGPLAGLDWLHFALCEIQFPGASIIFRSSCLGP